jgi:hypothetical protein
VYTHAANAAVLGARGKSFALLRKRLLSLYNINLK